MRSNWPSVKEGYQGNVKPLGHRSCYDEGKRCAETLFLDYRRASSIRTGGACTPMTAAWPTLSCPDAKGLPRSPSMAMAVTRARSLYRRFDRRHHAAHETLCYHHWPHNLGNPSEFTISRLADAVIRLTGSKSKVKRFPLPADDSMQRQPDISIANEKLGWQPTIELEDGLRQTIAYFDRLLSGASTAL
jgi:UDP-glucuronate decarboxylase